jgi:hypothetical protein
VTSGGGYLGLESFDGRWFWFTRRGEDGLWRMALPAGEPELAVPELDRAMWGNWAPVPEGVLFVAKIPGHRAAFLQWRERAPPREARGSRIEELVRLDGWPMNPSLAAGPQGRWLLWSQTEPGEVESDLMLVEGL